MAIKAIPKPEPAPKEYWEDSAWVHENSTDLSQRYPNMWVAVVNKKVVAYGENLAEVRDKGKKISGNKRAPVLILAEKGMHVY